MLFYLLTSKTVAITITRCSMSATRCRRLGAILRRIVVKFDQQSGISNEGLGINIPGKVFICKVAARKNMDDVSWLVVFV